MTQTSEVLSVRFEVAFNQIHMTLKNLVKSNNENFVHVLNLAEQRFSHVKPYYDRLKQYAKLRNSLVHYKLDPLKYIAEPHLDIVEDIEKIQGNLAKPPLALTIASKNVTTFSMDTKLDEVLKKVEETGFSQFPIYDGSGFRGLLTEGGIARWFSQNIRGGMVMTDGVTASDILNVEKTHNVHFIKRFSNIYELEDIFASYFDENKKLEAVIINQNGRSSEKPLGIITTWDLVQIDHTALALMVN